MTSTDRFFSRDISWLSFNERVLQEAARDHVPLLERIRFMSIYSSNLDEFYRVRMPALMALHSIDGTAETTNDLQKASSIIHSQQEYFGSILLNQILPALKADHVQFLYNQPIPVAIHPVITEIFFAEIAAFITTASFNKQLFAENNLLYLLTITTDVSQQERLYLINIPSQELKRFYTVQYENTTYVLFLDDIIKANLHHLFPGEQVTGAYTFKVTRDAELDLKDEYEEGFAERLEKLIVQRELGGATRLLHEPGIALRHLSALITQLQLHKAHVIAGGRYHNLKDLMDFPVQKKSWIYPEHPPVTNTCNSSELSLLDRIQQQDIILHPPYQSYHTVLRFFNEAATDARVAEIYVTLYRVAKDSRIVHALMSAAANGKKVFVFVELKARFDEANNIKWAKKMKEAGVKIIYSIPGLKVHAKVALVKKREGHRMVYSGLLATGNLNERTAAVYTDHVLLTANKELVKELELLFAFLHHRRKPSAKQEINFQHLLVAQFNLQDQFIALIDREIRNAKAGKKASIIIKMNNLEEKVLIGKLYEASNAGVKIQLIVRSICCLIPGVAGMSENIKIKRIVGRYLEHGRVFIFHNNGNEEVYLGSADWMRRNIYHRIEVCFPVKDAAIQTQLKEIIQLQLNDTIQAVWLNEQIENIPVTIESTLINSQEAIYQMLLQSSKATS